MHKLLSVLFALCFAFVSASSIAASHTGAPMKGDKMDKGDKMQKKSDKKKSGKMDKSGKTDKK